MRGAAARRSLGRGRQASARPAVDRAVVASSARRGSAPPRRRNASRLRAELRRKHEASAFDQEVTKLARVHPSRPTVEHRRRREARHGALHRGRGQPEILRDGTHRSGRRTVAGEVERNDDVNALHEPSVSRIDTRYNRASPGRREAPNRRSIRKLRWAPATMCLSSRITAATPLTSRRGPARRDRRRSSPCGAAAPPTARRAREG